MEGALPLGGLGFKVLRSRSVLKLADGLNGCPRGGPQCPVQARSQGLLQAPL